MSVVFGVHVGNSSSCVASWKDGKVDVVANDVGDRITPTMVSLSGSECMLIPEMSAKADSAPTKPMLLLPLNKRGYTPLRMTQAIGASSPMKLIMPKDCDSLFDYVIMSQRQAATSLLHYILKLQIVGLPAKSAIARNWATTVIHNKRLLDGNISDEEVLALDKKSPYKIVREMPADSPSAIRYELKEGDSVHKTNAKCIAVEIYSKLHEIASSSKKSQNSTRAVLCVPLHFTQKSRQLLMQCAEEAGFEILHVISEPAASLLGYGIGIQNADDLNCIVYRLGGITCDASVVEVHSGMFTVTGTVHRKSLGGDAFTDVLADYLADEYRKNLTPFARKDYGGALQVLALLSHVLRPGPDKVRSAYDKKCPVKYKLDPTESRRSMAKLRMAAETCKHVLSTMSTAHCFVESLCDGVDFSYNITRARFESLISPLIPQYLEPIEEALQKANVQSRFIDKVLLTGGSAKVPKVQQAAQDLFGSAEVQCGVVGMAPDEVIAAGAARHASCLHQAVDRSCHNLALDVAVLSQPIHVQMLHWTESECLIPANTAVPVVRDKKYSLTAPEEEVCFEISEADVMGQKPPRILGKAIYLHIPSSHDYWLNHLGRICKSIKVSLGRLEGPLNLVLEATVKSSGALSVVLEDKTSGKVAFLDLQPPTDQPPIVRDHK